MNQSILDSSELLTSFVNTYNLEQQESEENSIELTQIKLTMNLLTDENKQLKQQIAQQDNDLVTVNKGLADAQKLANTAITQKIELTRVREQLTTAQQELTTLNSQKNLKDQVKRVKEKSEEKSKTITRLNVELSTTKHELSQANEDKAACKKVVEMLKNEQGNNQAQGVYHNGDHHLVIWPQKSDMVRADGSEFQGTNLLYLHQSGRGGFITFDPQNDKSELCPQPKSGLRPSNEVKEFAHNWLYKVNQLQKGVIEDSDRTPINYNG